jgi:hypothetical protein
MRKQPFIAIKRKCAFCGDSSPCPMEDCPLYPFRMEDTPRGITPIQAIRDYCLYCMNYQEKEVYRCINGDCPFFRYRSQRA